MESPLHICQVKQHVAVSLAPRDAVGVVLSLDPVVSKKVRHPLGTLGVPRVDRHLVGSRGIGQKGPLLQQLDTILLSIAREVVALVAKAVKRLLVHDAVAHVVVKVHFKVVLLVQERQFEQPVQCLVVRARPEPRLIGRSPDVVMPELVGRSHGHDRSIDRIPCEGYDHMLGFSAMEAIEYVPPVAALALALAYRAHNWWLARPMPESVGDRVDAMANQIIHDHPDWMFKGHKRYYDAVLASKIAYSEYEGILDEELGIQMLPEGWRDQIEARIGGSAPSGYGEEVLKTTNDPKDFIKCPQCHGSFREQNMHVDGICQKCWHGNRDDGHVEGCDCPTQQGAWDWPGEYYTVDQCRDRVATMFAAPPMMLQLPGGQTLHQGETKQVQIAGKRRTVGFPWQADQSTWYDRYTLQGDQLERQLVQRDEFADEILEKVLQTDFLPLDDLKELKQINFERRRDSLINKLNEPRQLIRSR